MLLKNIKSIWRNSHEKRTVLVGMLAALTMFAAGCGGKDAAKESKVLRAGTEPTFAPFEFQERIPRISRALIWI